MPGFEAAHLPDSEKERLCRALLSEFGVTRVKSGGDGELIHSCVLPFGRHRNGDRNPSASLNWRKLTYNCLGCGNSGGLLWFIAVCRGESGLEARKWLDDATGIGPDEASLSSLLQFFDSVYGGDQNRFAYGPVPKMDPRILDPWLFIHPYMTEIRGVPEESLIALQVGYGVIPVNLGDRERPNWIDSHRIVIPHFWKGALVGWQTRRLIKDGTPKYLSSPDFPKDQTIYNYAERERRAIVVESPMSVIAKHHVGEHIEATFGAKVTDRQVKQLASHERVILWFDNDEAGWNATRSVGDRLEPYTDVWTVSNDLAADAADFTDSMYLEQIDGAVPYALWTPPKRLVRLEEVSA